MMNILAGFVTALVVAVVLAAAAVTQRKLAIVRFSGRDITIWGLQSGVIVLSLQWMAHEYPTGVTLLTFVAGLIFFLVVWGKLARRLRLLD